MDQRITQLAQTLITHSVRLQPAENLLIEVIDQALPLAQALIKAAYAVGGYPYVIIKNSAIQRPLLCQAQPAQLKLLGDWEGSLMQQMHAYIGIRAPENNAQLADVPPEKMELYQQLWSKPVHSDLRVPQTKWCVLRYPTPAMAQQAQLSTESFTDFFYRVCCIDYNQLKIAQQPLVELFNRTDKVRIIGPGTDLSFSIKNIPTVQSYGLRNIPDGEVFTAPIRDSVEGCLSYNVPAIYQGFTFDHVCFEFSQGKIIKATANDSTRLNQILDTDTGARYIGEFALGVNPALQQPMRDTLFDEKISGSFHFTPGNAYQNANNGNSSAIHWDLVCIQTTAYGGGEIWFDDVLIRKDGYFTLPELIALNPR